MDPKELAALYEAAEATDDFRLTLAIVRALGDPEFAQQARALLESAPATRNALSPRLNNGRRGRIAND